MATTVALSEAAARAGTRAANALQEGDEFPGALGAAKIAGFYDNPTLRSIFTTAFSHTWKMSLQWGQLIARESGELQLEVVGKGQGAPGAPTSGPRCQGAGDPLRGAGDGAGLQVDPRWRCG